MKRIFVLMPTFEKRLAERGGDDLQKIIENELLENPSVGDVVQGTGGVRKFRVSDPLRGKGKRGGLRVLYLDLPGLEKTILIYLYGKDEAEDLSAEQKKLIKSLVKIVKGEE